MRRAERELGSQLLMSKPGYGVNTMPAGHRYSAEVA